MQEDSQHPKGFSSGLVLGMVLGGIAAYMFAAPDGKKKFKDALEKGEEILGMLEEKILKKDGVVDQVKEAYEERIPEKAQSFVTNLHKKFFKKNGKKMS